VSEVKRVTSRKLAWPALQLVVESWIQSIAQTPKKPSVSFVFLSFLVETDWVFDEVPFFF